MSATLFSRILDLFLLLLSVGHFLVGALLVIVGGVAADIFRLALPLLSTLSSLITEEIPWGLIVREMLALMSAGWQNLPCAIRVFRLCLYEYARDTRDTVSVHVLAIHTLATDPFFRACAWAFVGLVIMFVENVYEHFYLDTLDHHLWAIVPVERHPYLEGSGTRTVTRKLVCGGLDPNSSECQRLAVSIWSSEDSSRLPYDGDLSVLLVSRPLATSCPPSRKFICWKSEPLTVTHSFCTADPFDHGPRVLQSTAQTLPLYVSSDLHRSPSTELVTWKDVSAVESTEVYADDILSHTEVESEHELHPSPAVHCNSSANDDDAPSPPSDFSDSFSYDNDDKLLPSPLPPPSICSLGSIGNDEDLKDVTEAFPVPPTPFFRFERNLDVFRVRVPKVAEATPDFRLNSIPTPSYWRNKSDPSPPPSPTPAGKHQPAMLASSSSSSLDLSGLSSDATKLVLPISHASTPPSVLPPGHISSGSRPSSPPSTPKSTSCPSAYVPDITAPSTPINHPLSYMNNLASESSLALLASSPLRLPAPGVFDETEEGIYVRKPPRHRSWTEGGIRWSSATFPVYIVRWPDDPGGQVQFVSGYNEYYISATSLATGVVQASFTTLPL
ncbi:hypothetical protein BV25DRAFT_1827885 [Artomyces pyxidatus]|uniref:Uncharacterized protein n=1 Tax=Artomyces pyxidatus TaxID=48021 RepID=A0ACB8SWV4_9AGAM|nr:hypothetical protein BV25DRAFT_1827885 [Artomyces pyxidatus]